MEWLNTREGERLGALGPAVDALLADLVERDAVARIWGGDHTLWQEDPTEVADRLGWLRVGTEVAAALIPKSTCSPCRFSSCGL